jgi:hypothetical protein
MGRKLVPEFAFDFMFIIGRGYLECCDRRCPCGGEQVWVPDHGTVRDILTVIATHWTESLHNYEVKADGE